jgi:hypothetical protein
MRLHRLHFRPIQRKRRCFDSASSASSATSSETVSTIGAAGGSASGTGRRNRERAERELVHQRIAQLFFREGAAASRRPRRREQQRSLEKISCGARGERHAHRSCSVRWAERPSSSVVPGSLPTRTNDANPVAAVRQAVDADPLRHGASLRPSRARRSNWGGIERRAHRVD